MIQRLISAIARSVVHRRRVWAISISVLSIGALWAGSHLEFHLDAHDFLPTSTRQSDPLEPQLSKRLAGTGRIVIILESPKALEVHDVARVFSYLAVRIQQLEGVSAVEYRVAPEVLEFLDVHARKRLVLYVEPALLRAASTRLTREGIERALAGESATQERPAVKLRATEADPLGLLGLASRTVRREAGTSRVEIVEGYFALPDHKKFFLTVEPEAGLEDIKRAEMLVRGVERELEEARSAGEISGLLEGKRLFIVGRPVSYVSAFETIYADVLRFALSATALVLLALALFFRRPLAPVVMALPILVGLSLTACLGFLIFRSISLIAWIFVGVLVGLGVDFGIHIAAHYWVHGEPRAGRSVAVVSAVLRPGRGIVFGAFTSAAAFFSLQVVAYPVMKQLAWMTAIGLLAILAASFTALPLGLSFTAPRRRPETIWRHWGALFDRLVRSGSLWGAAPWLVLVAAALLALPSIRFEPHPWKLALRGNPKSAELERLSREFGSSFTPLLMVVAGATQEEAIARNREATRLLQRGGLRAGISYIESLSRWLPPEEQQLANIEFVEANRELFSPSRFRRDFEEVATTLNHPDRYLTEEYLPQVARFLHPDQHVLTLDELRELGLAFEIDRYLINSSSEHLAVSYIYLRSFPWAEGVVSRFLETFEQVGGGQLAGVTFMGDALRSSTHGQILRRDTLLAALVAFLLVIGVLWIQFRNAIAAGLCLVPLACGVSAAILVMAAFQIELNMLTLSIAPILIGIGVDDGIHMVERLEAGQSPNTVLCEAGSSMTMTTLTSVGAFACLGLATFHGFRELGVIASVGLVACLLASLHLIPLCHGLWRAERNGRS